MRFELAVYDGWHVNAKPASLEILVPTQMRVFIGDREVSLDTNFPLAHQVPAEALDEGPIDVYSGLVAIALVLAESVDPDAPLEATVRIHACNDNGRCLAPETLEREIER